MKKVLIMLADGFETLEALSVKDICERAQVKCDLCSIDKKVVRSAHNIKVESDILIDEIVLDYDAIVIPGGMPGAKNLREDKRVISLIKEFNSNEKIVASICAGPTALAIAGVIDGKKVTSYPNVKDELGNVEYLEEIVVRDNNIITSRGPATALEFSYEILKALGYSEKANEIRKAMLVEFYLGK